jgi:hypothetical protein
MTRPAPNSHRAPVAQNASPVRQKAKSQRNAKTKNAIGKGITIGCKGWPAIEAVLFGLGVVEVGNGESPPPEKRCSVARYKMQTYSNVPHRPLGWIAFYCCEMSSLARSVTANLSMGHRCWGTRSTLMSTPLTKDRRFARLSC